MSQFVVTSESSARFIHYMPVETQILVSFLLDLGVSENHPCPEAHQCVPTGIFGLLWVTGGDRKAALASGYLRNWSKRQASFLRTAPSMRG
jgi:hypothetical protein